MILFSHPTGNANVRHAAMALEEEGLLDEFWTCVSWDPHSLLNHVLPRKIRRQLCRRALPAILRPKVRHVPWREAGRMLASQLGWESWIAHERGFCSIDAVYQNLDREVAWRVMRAEGLSAVYAYEDGAAETFMAAKARGLKCIYDLPIGYWRAAHALYEEEKVREPEWAGTLTGTFDSREKLMRKDEELKLADTIIVASSFTRKTIESAPDLCGKPVHIIPYGSPVARPTAILSRTSSKLKVLFVGGLGQRKGLSYLLKAIEMLGDSVELTLIGMKTVENCAPLNQALRRYHWVPSLPHDEVLREMHRHDVFVFPSLFEGFGLVILEAMSQGLPVIATEHTAGPDLIEEGRSGFIVPIRSAEAIAEKLELLAADPNLLAEMKAAARQTAAKQTWERYRSELARTIIEEITPAPLPK